jgi:GNAT superfamily N-acetyltransferase
LSSPDVDIRLVRADEHDELRDVRLRALSYSPVLADYLARESAAGEEFWRERAAQGAAAVDRATFVAESAEGFVGVVDGFLSSDGRTIDIGGMWVAPDVRRRGIGSALVEAVCDWGRERDARRAALWVREANANAQTLYEAAGFEPGDRSGEGETAGIRLVRPL